MFQVASETYKIASLSLGEITILGPKQFCRGTLTHIKIVEKCDTKNWPKCWKIWFVGFRTFLQPKSLRFFGICRIPKIFNISSVFLKSQSLPKVFICSNTRLETTRV